MGRVGGGWLAADGNYARIRLLARIKDHNVRVSRVPSVGGLEVASLDQVQPANPDVRPRHVVYPVGVLEVDGGRAVLGILRQCLERDPLVDREGITEVPELRGHVAFPLLRLRHAGLPVGDAMRLGPPPPCMRKKKDQKFSFKLT